MKDIMGNKLEFGQRVRINSCLDRQTDYPNRTWKSLSGGFPRDGLYIGYRTIYEGVLRAKSYDDPGYLSVTKSHVVYLVVEAENKKPFYSDSVQVC